MHTHLLAPRRLASLFTLAVILAGGCAQAGSTQITSKRVVSGLSKPVAIASIPGDNTRLFIVEQHSGQIRIVDLTTNTILAAPFLTISAATTGNNVTTGGEQGLLGLAFHPNYAVNGFFYVNYTTTGGGPAGRTVIERYQVSAGNPNIADPASDMQVLAIDQPETNHNGGWLGFGPDGFLYISMGDGGGGNDRHGTIGNAQDLNSLLGKILRVDVSGDAFPGDAASNYLIPSSNPFAGAIPGRDEVWAFGLRNPWRCSFDRLTGDFWNGDVGESTREEINFQPAGSSGLNYGWRPREGKIQNPNYDGTPFPSETPVTLATMPIYDYDHTVGVVVICGYVYRGSAIAGLQGTYFYADIGNGKIWSFDYSNNTVNNFMERSAQLAPGGALNIIGISAFGEDASGELYFADYSDGEIFKIVSVVQIDTPAALPASAVNTAFQQTLSASGGVAPYTWSVTAGTLPAGITLSTAGVLSGTAQAAGDFSFTLQASDAGGATNSRTFTLTISSATSIITVSPLPSGNQGVVYSQVLAVSGGAAPFTWSATGTLPPGLQLSASGVLSGTPTQSGTFSFVVQVSDAAAQLSSKNFDLTILPPPLIASAPVATPVPAIVSEPVLFTASAPNAQTWLWQFGDGATAGTIASATHTYSAPGFYIMTLTVTDGAGFSGSATLSVTVLAPGPGDTDGDGFTDTAEFNAGSNPFDANSIPTVPFLVTKLKGTANFKTAGKDSASFSAVIPAQPSGLDTTGLAIMVDIGGARESVLLDVKGRGITLNAKVTLKLKPRRRIPGARTTEFAGGPVSTKVSIKKGSWADDWLDEGVNPQNTVSSLTATFGVDVIFNGVIYRQAVETFYKGRATRSGSFKQKK